MSFQVPPEFEPAGQIGIDVEDEQTEMFLLRVPKGMDIQKLNGVKFSRSRVKQVKSENNSEDVTAVFEITPFDGQSLQAQPLLTSGSQVTVGPPLSGMLSVTKSYKAKATSDPDFTSLIPSTGPVPMPEGLRVRYQPFGAGQPVKTPVSGKKHKSGKKRRHRNKDEDSVSGHKKSRADVGMESDDEGSEKLDVLESSSSNHTGIGKSPHKAKKSKRKSKCLDGSDEVSPSKVKKELLGLDDMMFVDRKGNERLLEMDSGNVESSLSNGLKSPKSAKKHKKSHSHSNLSEDNSSLTSSGFVSEGSAKKKKHKAKKGEPVL